MRGRPITTTELVALMLALIFLTVWFFLIAPYGEPEVKQPPSVGSTFYQGGYQSEPMTTACKGYVVKQNDRLAQIAYNNKTTVEELSRLNNLSNPNRIYAGQCLIVK